MSTVQVDIEGHHLEFKRQLTDALEKEAIAFLNARDGGVIIIGIDKSGKVIGVDNSDALQLIIKDRLKNNISPSTMGLFDVVSYQQEGKLLIKIILASGSEKPYYLSKKGMSAKGCFIRIGSASEPMSERMIEELFARRVRHSIGNISSRYQDLSFEQLKIYYNETPYKLNEQFARNLELLNGEGQYNYAAYLLADSNGCSIKVAKYAGTTRVDLLENEEYGHCSLIKATKSVLDKLTIENRTFTKITAAERIEQKQINPIALREAVINAIIHNDYSNEASPKFELFSDRLEVTSAGVIPLGLSKDDFFKGYSIPQNKELMRIFRDLELVEQLGSGIPRILQSYSPAIYHFSPNFIRVTFKFEQNSTLAESPTLQAIPQATPQATPQAKKILSFCQEPKSRAEIQNYLKLKDREHFRKTVLLPLLEAGLLALTLPDKPTSPKQKFITLQGVLDNREGK